MAAQCRLTMVILMVNDIEKAVSFYETLGGQKRCLFPKSWAELTLNGITIALCHTEQSQVQRRTGLVFSVESLASFYESHKETLSFLEAPVTKLHGIMVSVQDPSGNVLELYQPTPEKVREFMAQNKDGCCSGDAGSDVNDTCCKS